MTGGPKLNSDSLTNDRDLFFTLALVPLDMKNGKYREKQLQ